MRKDKTSSHQMGNDKAFNFDRDDVSSGRTELSDSALEALDRELNIALAQQKKAAQIPSTKKASAPYRFPSMKKMYREANTRAKLLAGISDLEAVRDKLETCRCEDEEDCGLVCCPIDWLDHGKLTYKKMRKQFEDRECSAVTVLYRLVPRGELDNYKPFEIKDALTKFFRRCGIKEAMGGIEAEWKPKHEAWMIHAHAIMPASENEAIEVARERLLCFDVDRPLVKQSVVDRKRQFSYATKFPTYYRLPLEERKALSYACSWKSNKRRLPSELFEELVRWSMDASFNDLSIRIGTRKKR